VAAAAAASEAATPAAPSDKAVRIDASAAQSSQQLTQPVVQACGVQHLEVQQQLVALQPAPTGLKGRAAADSTGSKVGFDVPVTAADAVDAVPSMPTVGEHPHLPPIKTVSKRGRFVVTKLTPASTACCTPKSACAATTPTAAAAAAAGFGTVSAAEPAAEGVSGGCTDLSVSSLGPLVTCPVCAVAQVMPQLPHQLSGQLLGLITEREAGGLQQQQQLAGTTELQAGGTAAAAAAAACDAIAAAVSETQAAAGLKPEAGNSSSSTVVDGQQLAAAEGPFGISSSSAGMQAPLPTCSSCGAPLPPMSQQEYQSAAAAAAAGVLDVAAAAAAAAHLQPAAATAAGEACGSTSSSMQSSWHEAAVEVQGSHHLADTQQGPSPSTPQGLLAIAAVRVLAARQREQQLAQQRKQQQQHPRESHDPSSGGPSTSRTPGYYSSNHRGSMDPGHWAGNSCSTVGGGPPDLLSESSYQHSAFSSGRSSSSSILAQPCMRGGASSSTMHGAQHNSGAVGFVGFGGNDARASAALPTHPGAGGSSYCRSPADGSSPAAAITPHASAADSPMRWAVQQRAVLVPALVPAEHVHVLGGPAAAVAPALAAEGAAPAGEGAALPAAPAVSLSVEGGAALQDGLTAALAASAQEGAALPAATAAVPASVSPVPSSATYWPRSHAAEWMDALGSAEASSNDCSDSRG
jgi:hypothetical protein